MVTKRLSHAEKVHRAFGRAFSLLGVPALVRRNWLNVLMPWRLLPYPIALSLIGLVALAMVCSDPAPGTWQEPTSTPEPAGISGQAIAIIGTCADKGGTLDMTTGECIMPATVGGTFVPADLACEEDQVIGFVGIPDTLVCIQFDETEADADGCVPPAFFSEELTHCVLPDGGLPCDVGHSLVDGRCEPVTAAPEVAFDNDGCDPPLTWAGSIDAGYRCVPLVSLEQEGGRSGHIIVAPTGSRAGGTVTYHTAPCHAHDTVLPPPYADVTLCVNADEWAAVN